MTRDEIPPPLSVVKIYFHGLKIFFIALFVEFGKIIDFQGKRNIFLGKKYLKE